MKTKHRAHDGEHYFEPAFQQDRLVREARAALKDVDFDTMIGRGLSGALVIPVLARSMRKNFAIVRKETDDTHDNCEVVGYIGERWIFVDDFVSSGETKRAVVDAVDDLDLETEYVGTYEYAEYTWDAEKCESTRGGHWYPNK